MRPKFRSTAAALFFFCFMHVQECLAIDIAVIVNASGPLLNATGKEIKSIYLGEKRFEGKIKVVPFNYKEGTVKDKFIKEVAGKLGKEYKLYWTRKIFQSGIAPPKILYTPRELINAVRANRGGIGYLPRNRLKDAEGITVIMLLSE